MDFNHPEVTEEMKRWGVWIAQTLDADGMRLDALKHIKNAFIADFMHNVRASRGKEFYAVGEYWSGDFESLEAYLDALASVPRAKGNPTKSPRKAPDGLDRRGR